MAVLWPEQHLSDGRLFWTMFTAMQSKLHHQRIMQASVVQAIRNFQREREHPDQRRCRLMLGAALLVAREKANMDVSVYKHGGMKRQDTVMRKAISLDKRVAIALYRLATSAEERTVANLFGVSRSSVDLIFREFCGALSPISLHAGNEHLRQFVAVTGFPQCVRALDVCHIERRYRFTYVNVGSPGKNHDAAVFESSRLPKVLASELFQLEEKIVEGNTPRFAWARVSGCVNDALVVGASLSTRLTDAALIALVDGSVAATLVIVVLRLRLEFHLRLNEVTPVTPSSNASPGVSSME
ncbi:hypothetical protein HPB52_003548 [Rhipicephalus sanguineus]|uniref:Uncharacterized protein n=1 Tax=Rhipicephalus sanguineus TaxID=34632 RepID=A0A9D4QH72_RHISA|nr:hypothetical protein HPB52_003548 [Rhipicephalus sanguineus]